MMLGVRRAGVTVALAALKTAGLVQNTHGQVVIIVDDVVSSGKTLLYSVKPFLEFQPKKIQTLVLVERSYKSFPVRPDYVGLSISTTLLEHIFVEVKNDEVTGAYLV